MNQHFVRPPGGMEPISTNYSPDPPPDSASVVRAIFVHCFILLLEAGLLTIQYVRMEAVAFDLLPEIADAHLGGVYGSQLMGALWMMVVIFISYIFWEIVIRLQERGGESSWALRVACIAFAVFNAAAMVFEFTLFRMLVDDLSTLGFNGEAELFGALMVGVHQAASLWIVRNIVRQIFVDDEPEFVPEDEKDF